MNSALGICDGDENCRKASRIFFENVSLITERLTRAS